MGLRHSRDATGVLAGRLVAQGHRATQRPEDLATVAAEVSEVAAELVWHALTAQHPATP
jgi:hypothetical protein